MLSAFGGMLRDILYQEAKEGGRVPFRVGEIGGSGAWHSPLGNFPATNRRHTRGIIFLHNLSVWQVLQQRTFPNIARTVRICVYFHRGHLFASSLFHVPPSSEVRREITTKLLGGESSF